ncbi:hypothetical protein ACFQ3W_17130 [Paenibacillus puldeungensis]|uniref:Alpha/beta hydrolase n=1 Tax=Paenibacillus puldeungensis TaxID=696536 RepID=A0ABW3S1J7_9BACL
MKMKVERTEILSPSIWGVITANSYYTQAESDTLVVLFPGIGYHCDKPLLYFSQQVAMKNHCDLLVTEYGFQKTKAGFEPSQIDDLVKEVLFSIKQVLERKSYRDIVFVSKSLGTYVAKRISSHIKARNFVLTPIQVTMPLLSEQDYVAIGTADHLATEELLQVLRARDSAKTMIIENVGHSLEADTIKETLNIIEIISEKLTDFIHKDGTTK